MPASHWAFELQFGSPDWLPPLLEHHAIDPQLLRPLADASAIEFQLEEAESLIAFMQTLFERMTASDFTAAFPGRAVVAMLHHHQQIWWQTSDPTIHDSLDSLLPAY